LEQDSITHQWLEGSATRATGNITEFFNTVKDESLPSMSRFF